MRTIGIRLGGGIIFAGALLLALVAAFPGRRWTFVAGFELVVGAFGVAAVVAALRALRPRGWEARTPFDGRRRDEAPGPIAELERIDRMVVLGAANAFDAHHRLRPLLRELAAERLHAHHGVSLDRDPERAQELLGEELWNVVRPDAELRHRSGPGVGIERTARLVDALEAV